MGCDASFVTSIADEFERHGLAAIRIKRGDLAGVDPMAAPS
jgi:hypothetical protein